MESPAENILHVIPAGFLFDPTLEKFGLDTTKKTILVVSSTGAVYMLIFFNSSMDKVSS